MNPAAIITAATGLLEVLAGLARSQGAPEVEAELRTAIEVLNKGRARIDAIHARTDAELDARIEPPSEMPPTKPTRYEPEDL